MLSYLILSFLLSILGFVFYNLFIKKHSTVHQRKYTLYFILGISLLLPLGLVESSSLLDVFAKDHLPINELCLASPQEAIISCYDKAISQSDFCNCEAVEQSNIILYEPNHFYNTYLTYQNWVYNAFLFIISTFLVFVLFRLAYLNFLIKTSRKHTCIIEEQQYTILQRSGNMVAASFGFFKQFIVWDTRLTQLEQKEQNAVLWHEIAHLKNKDTWEQLGLSLLQCLWFSNPIFYFIKRELDLLNEFMADTFAVQKTGLSPKAYALLLVKLKEQQQNGYVAHFSSYESLRQRIERLLSPTESASKRLYPILFSLILIMLSIGGSAMELMTIESATFEEYCVLQEQYSSTGSTFFCKHCLGMK